MNLYLLFKSLHLIAVISWMAGLLYLPRIFVYHADTKENIEQKETFKTMERKLFFYIMNPAMILSWIFGLYLLHIIGSENFFNFWLQLKLLMVILMTFFHFFLFFCLKSFAQDRNKYTSKFFRITNEVPTVLLIITIFLVVFKPL
jgi:putative membrane protein